MKRFLDIIFSFLAILLLSPLLLPLILLLRFSGEGHIFYKQERIGLNGRPFYLFKFATMFIDSPNMEGGNITSKNDPRILPIGGFLRKYKINELPQIFNVLIGEMSIIGRRPTVKEHFDFYEEEVIDIIKKNKPGLSGISSIIFRDEEIYFVSEDSKENKIFYSQKIAPFKGALEVWYSKNQSLYIDIILIILTLLTIFLPSNNFHNYIFYDLPKHPLFNPE
jgi:lipopolysaccharide/colanic/teichoic acid biosynthesis glycosyltransferase